jgi:hypothetical protein
MQFSDIRLVEQILLILLILVHATFIAPDHPQPALTEATTTITAHFLKRETPNPGCRLTLPPSNLL